MSKTERITLKLLSEEYMDRLYQFELPEEQH